jgi:hypothetical protein
MAKSQRPVVMDKLSSSDTISVCHSFLVVAQFVVLVVLWAHHI